ncbi:helix-turn-helix transcriptional regulator [Actinosynnema sp. NPDC053489]|uniref:helix-turn-helix transcriptional regulator n=1 Tax=Actinosynnema sp. NPDC053489 TaxID=3363916 RepID=UPI0037C9C85A
MRADRLVAVLLLLQVRGRVTAAEVAAELEVSLATARRDLEALSAAGVPVYAQPGRGGGWRLVGRARTDLSGLTAAEARALFLLVGPAAAGSAEVRGVVRKLVRALPETFREGALAAAGAVVVDVAGWGGVGRVRPGLVGVLEEAVVGRRRVVLGYAGRGGVRSERVVEPWGLVVKDGVWYLVAGTGAGERTFRVDRVVSARVTGEVFERPAGLELSVVWGRVVAEVERRRSSVSAVVWVPSRWAGVLGDQFGRHCEVVEVVGGRSRVRVSAGSAVMVAQVLAGWGGLVEVVGPVEVRAELARLGGELVGLYGRG